MQVEILKIDNFHFQEDGVKRIKLLSLHQSPFHLCLSVSLFLSVFLPIFYHRASDMFFFHISSQPRSNKNIYQR